MPDRPPVSAEDIPQSVHLAHCREVGDLIPYRCGYAGVNEIACEGTPCPIYEYRLVRDDEATVERMAQAVEAELSWPSASREFYRDLVRVALTAAQEGEAT